ncbi:MAG TPA: hypothetical protein VEC99_16955, partial [Clostridia bacterium]|nr:hypothetical protein [Clostridia bacterium]
MIRVSGLLLLSSVLAQSAPTNVAALASQATAQPHHKVQVSDPALGQRILSEGGRLIGDYGNWQLYETGQLPPDLATNAGISLRNEYNHIRLHAKDLDTTQPQTKALSQSGSVSTGKQMHLIQFRGPV